MRTDKIKEYSSSTYKNLLRKTGLLVWLLLRTDGQWWAMSTHKFIDIFFKKCFFLCFLSGHTRKMMRQELYPLRKMVGITRRISKTCYMYVCMYISSSSSWYDYVEFHPLCATLLSLYSILTTHSHHHTYNKKTRCTPILKQDKVRILDSHRN